MTQRGTTPMFRARWHILLSTLIVASALARPAHAQEALRVTDLDGRVSPALAARVRVLTDSAGAARLPVSPLVDKALEGASKHAPDERIVAAVQSVLSSLRVARAALGPGASDPELVAGMVVLRAGVPSDALADARRRLPHRSLAVPLSVLGSLVAAGVPATAAENAVVAQAARSDDAAMLAFGRNVERSIASGVSPTMAASDVPTSLHGAGAPGGATPRPKP